MGEEHNKGGREAELEALSCSFPLTYQSNLYISFRLSLYRLYDTRRGGLYVLYV